MNHSDKSHGVIAAALYDDRIQCTVLITIKSYGFLNRTIFYQSGAFVYLKLRDNYTPGVTKEKLSVYDQK